MMNSSILATIVAHKFSTLLAMGMGIVFIQSKNFNLFGVSHVQWFFSTEPTP
jgi:hypothetical protein